LQLTGHVFSKERRNESSEQAGRRNYFSTGDNVTFRLKVVNTEYFPGGCSFFLIETVESRSFTSPRRLIGNEPMLWIVVTKTAQLRKAKKKDFQACRLLGRIPIKSAATRP
jgi:hypothetical protein